MRLVKFAIFISIMFFGMTTVNQSKAECPATITTSNPLLNLPCPSDDPRWAEAFSHWDRRADNDELKEATRIFESLAKDKPDQVEARLWLLKSYYMAAVRARGAERKELAKKAVAEADRALELDPQNGAAKYWRWSAMLHYHEFTEADFDQIRSFGSNYSHLREIPVPDDDPAWKKAMAHWDARYTYEEGIKAIAIFEDLEKKYPDRIEPKLWLMRSNFWMQYIESAPEARPEWCMTAAKWGYKALDMEPRNPAVHYLIAGSLGQYGAHTSFLNYVRYSLEISRHLTVVMEEDPNYYYGGLSQYLALAIARGGSLTSRMMRIVGFEEDLIERSTHFAARYEPRYLRNFYALGELYLMQGKREEAKEMLERVINSDPSELYQMEPENRVVQDIARDLLKKEFPQ